MARASPKYKRYVPSYRPELRWRQTTVLNGFLAAYVQARDNSRASGKREPIRGFGGWYVSRPGEDLQ